MIKSPIQYISDKVALAQAMAHLLAIHQKFLDSHEEIKKHITNLQRVGPKGTDGKSIAGPKGEDGQDGEKGQDGKTPTKNELLAIIEPLIPEVKDKKIVITETHIDRIAERAAKKIKLPEYKKDELDIENLLSLIEKRPKGKRLNMDFVDGLSQTIQSLSSQITSKGYLHGGGDTVAAGSNITITVDANGKKTISSSSVGFQTPTSGVVDGNNATYIWATDPNIIVVDEGRAMRKTSSDGTINWTGTTTTVLTIAPTSDIYATN